MAILEYPVFYRKFGVRFLETLSKPNRFKITQLELPKSSLYHFISDTETDTGPDVDEPPLRFVQKVIMVDHVTDLSRVRGNPRPTMQPFGKLIREYHLRYRRTRPLRSLATTEKDPMTLVVENYALLNHLYRYMASVFSHYNEWYNIQATVFDKIAKLTEETARHQFIPITLPQRLPTFDFLKMMEKNAEPDKRLIDHVDEPNGWLLLEFWKWLGEYRSLSLFAKIPEAHLSKINIIWMESGHWVMINLGMVNEWRNKFIDKDPTRIQRLWLRSIIHLLGARSVIANNETTETSDSDKSVTDTTEPTDNGVKSETRDSSVSDAIDDVEDELSNLPGVDDEDENDDSIFVIPEDTPEPVVEGPDTDAVAETQRVDELTPEEDEKELQELSDTVIKTKSETVYAKYTHKDQSSEVAIGVMAAEYAEKGMITPPEYRQIVKQAERYKSIRDPFGGNQTLVEASVITPEALAIPKENRIVGEIAGVTDSSMLNSSLEKFDSHYIDNIMDKHIAKSVLAIQSAGISIQDYQVEKVSTLTDNYLQHSIKVTPVVGKPSTLKFKTPVVSNRGTFMSGGNKLLLRKQRGDLPIRKVSPSRVALTSYYSKVFIDRTDRKTNNYDYWITNQIRAAAFVEQPIVTDIRLGNVFDNELKLPRIYSILAKEIIGFQYKNIPLVFDYHQRVERFGEALLAIEKQHGMVVVSQVGKTWYLVDDLSMFYKTTDDNKLVELGNIETLLNLDHSKAPISYAEIGIMGQTIPLGVVMASMLGLGVLTRTLGVTPKRIKTGMQVNLGLDEFALRFSDETLVFKKTPTNELIFNGFNRFHRDIRRFSVYEFDKANVYTVIFDKNNIGARYTRELKLMNKLWVDPITRSVLEEMREPTYLIGLFTRAVELLTTDWHPDPMDMEYMRDKGYERIAGGVYTELCRAIRQYNARPTSKAISVEVNPQAVWMSLLQDPAVILTEDTNPIHNLKEKEEVIFGGVGGRSSRSMTVPTRRYHKSAMGVVSEATKDNSDVGTITYLTADPNYTSVLGFTRRREGDEGTAKMVSTSMLLSPGADRDDPRRVGFISVQNSQSISTKGYTPMPLRTGYERVLAHRTDALYASTAKQKGKVTAFDNELITITYENGETETYDLGRQFGVSAGTVLPHKLKTDLRLGQKVDVGDVIAYNENFFTRDTLFPNQVIYKAGVLAKTVLWESTDTLEDSSAISLDLSRKLATEMTNFRTIKVKFDQEIRGLVKLGSEIGVESILCTIENSTESSGDLFDADSLETLRLLSNLTPRAKYSGVVEKIEVFYRGDIDDMSDSLRELANTSDRQKTRLSRKKGGSGITGELDPNIRVDGDVLEPDSVAIRIYITGLVPFNTGDKGVFGAQLKTTVGRVINGVNETETGKTVDAIFGYRSVNDRIVNSATLMGTTNSLLIEFGRRAIAAYRQK